MELWYTEDFHDGWRLSVRVERALASLRSRYQRIDVLQTRDVGRVLVIDGKVQACELDEFVYHEMMVHLPMLTHPGPRRVLVIGGGDGGCMREILKHSSVEEALLVDIDEEVIRLCSEHLPTLAAGLREDPRLRIVPRDGAEFIRECRDLDVILVDSSDPAGPSERLFASAFYGDLRQALAPGGVVAVQAGSPFFYRDQVAGVVRDLRELFPVVRPYLIPMPTYPSGTWTLCCASLGPDPHAEPDLDRSGALRTRYYSAATHAAALALPPFLRDALGRC